MHYCLPIKTLLITGLSSSLKSQTVKYEGQEIPTGKFTQSWNLETPGVVSAGNTQVKMCTVVIGMQFNGVTKPYSSS